MVDNLARFKTLIDDANEIGSSVQVFRSPTCSERHVATDPAVIRQLDALLGFLAQTAEAFTAEWQLRSSSAAAK